MRRKGGNGGLLFGFQQSVNVNNKNKARYRANRAMGDIFARISFNILNFEENGKSVLAERADTAEKR